MGKGTDKLFITHSEHIAGSHSSSVGAKQKQQAPHPGNRTPFDCCALSLQPFAHPVCARNPDGTGTVFDLVNIIPWLKQHKNTHPITAAPLVPADLLTLHYSRKPSGEIHDPISFKPFSEHSHIVAVATTGNVFLASSVKGGTDLVADVPFKKEDLITLQNPHAVPTTPFIANPKEKPKEKSAVAPAGPLVKVKEPVPYNISPYSTGAPGASLTSTSIDPQTAAVPALYDEEELMFETVAAKVKGKEKNVGKRRAYVRVVTSLAGGALNLELYCEKAPKTCYNFLMLARAGKYDGCPFHRVIPGFMAQTGDPTGTGSGGASHWGTPFRDEIPTRGAPAHDARGVLSMANRGRDTNGSQWFLTLAPASHLDGKHTVFGKLVGGEEVLAAIEALPRKDGTDRPLRPPTITEVVIYQDPFVEYQTRLARKIARAAAGPEKPKERSDVNWFGEKLGTAPAAGAGAGSTGEGVGRYLAPIGTTPAGPKRAAPAPAPLDEGQAKKRKLGFGDFDGW